MASKFKGKQQGQRGGRSSSAGGRGRSNEQKERKSIEHRWDKKFKDEVVDYFGSSADKNTDDQMFNKMPILKENNRVMKPTKKQKVMKTKKEDLNSDDEFERIMNMGNNNKKQKVQDDDNDGIFGGQEGIFAPLSASFASFFVNNKYALLQLEKVPVLRYTPGTQVLASVSEYGHNGQFMVANLSRNKKGFVTIADSTETQSEQTDLRVYDQGEYFIGEVVQSVKEGNLNISMKTSKLNNGLLLADIHENMVIPGLVSSKEEHGLKITLNGGEKYFGFMPKEESKDFNDIEEGRVYMFRVTKKETKKRLVHLTQGLYSEEKKFVVSGEVDIEDGADLHHLAKPGNLVSCVVLKTLSNGIIVRFLKQFIGFIFEDHLEKEPSQYKEKEKFEARIIASDFDQKQINLSIKKVHLQLTPFNDERIVTGDVLTDGFLVKKSLYGGSFFVKPSNSPIEKAFLHKAHCEIEDLKEGMTYKEALKIKEINYFEQMPIVTAKGELVKKVSNWNDLRPGQLLTGKVEKIIQGQNNQFKLKVSVNDKMIGLIDFFNTSDNPKAGPIPKTIKEGRRIKVRVLNVNASDKSLRLTIKPTFLNEEEDQILKTISIAKVGESYMGFISRRTDYGFIIQFFGEVIGLLTFKDIEETNGRNKDEFKVGQSLRVYVVFVNQDAGKIGLSISEKGVAAAQESKSNLNTSRKTLFDLDPLNEAVENITHNVGDIVEYSVENHQAFQDILTLYHKDHRAIIAIEHLSDHKSNYHSLSQYYRTLPNKGNQVTIKCKIIQVMPNKNIIVTAKPSLLSDLNPNSIEAIKSNRLYTGYIDRGARKGVVVKFNERIKIFIGKENLNTQNVSFDTYDTVLVFVKNVEGEKITASLQDESVFKKQLGVAQPDSNKFSRFVEYFTEEHQLNRKFGLGEARKLWNKYRVGNYVNTTIELIKEFGIVVKVDGSPLAGLIMNEHVLNLRSTLKVGATLLCRIIDVDFEKQMVDLIPSPIEKEEKLTTLLSSQTFNLEKFLEVEGSDTTDLTVISQKQGYLICHISKSPKVICYVNMTNFNNVEHEEMLFGQKIKNATCVNKDRLVKSGHQANAALRSSYIPLYEQPVNNSSKELDGKKGVTLKAGIKVVGKVLKTVGYNVLIQLKGKLYGKLHKSQCQDEEQFESLKEGTQIDCKILYIKQDTTLQIDLTTKKAHMEAALLDEKQLLPLNVEDFTIKSIGSVQNAVVKSVDPSSIHPIYLELSNHHHGFFSAFDLDAKLLSEIKKTYKKGSIVSCKIVEIDSKKQSDLKHIKLSPVGSSQSQKENSSIRVGDLVTAKVVKKNAQGLRVQISDSLFGNVDITEICDEWISNPTSSITLNSFIPARVILEEGDHKHLSLRASVTSSENWRDALGPTGSTISYKKAFADIEKIGDLRNRVIKLGPGSLKLGMVFVGYVNQTNDKGCFIKIAQDTAVRCGQNELSDEHIANPSSHFYKNRLVVGRIISIKDDGKIDASLRESVIKHGYSMDESKLKVGLTVHGVVVGHYQGRASVSIRGCKFRASLDKDDTDFSEEEKMGYVEKLLPVGTQIKAKIMKYEKEPKMKILLSTEKESFAKYSSTEEMEIENSELNHLDLLISSVSEINSQAPVVDLPPSEIKITKSFALPREEKEGVEIEENNSDNEDEEGSEIGDEEIQKLMKGNHKLVIEGMDSDDDEDGDEQEGDNGQDDDDEMDSEEEEEGDDDDIMSEHSFLDDEEDELLEDGIITNQKKSKRQKEIEKRRKEEEIRKQELKLIDQDALPEQRDDYEKLVLKNPNSSYVWIQFIAWVMEKEGIQSAREITERALRVINFKNENEKLNLWTAFLNLEHNFGDEKSLVKVFERAKASCKPKNVFFKLLEIYRRDTSKLDLLFQLSKNMATKFKHSSKVWIEHLKNVILYRDHMIEKKQENKLNQSHDPKEVLKRSLICLKKKKHVVVLCQYARLQYESNQQEIGRTTFEAVLANFPKRTDIWSVYLDMEMKHASSDSARNLFNRVITMEFKARQMKFFFRKFLTFEATRGSAEGVELVKEKAAQFVASLIGQEGEEEEEGGNNNNEEIEIEENHSIEEEK